MLNDAPGPSEGGHASDPSGRHPAAVAPRSRSARARDTRDRRWPRGSRRLGPPAARTAAVRNPAPWRAPLVARERPFGVGVRWRRAPAARHRRRGLRGALLVPGRRRHDLARGIPVDRGRHGPLSRPRCAGARRARAARRGGRRGRAPSRRRGRGRGRRPGPAARARPPPGERAPAPRREGESRSEGSRARAPPRPRRRSTEARRGPPSSCASSAPRRATRARA